MFMIKPVALVIVISCLLFGKLASLEAGLGPSVVQRNICLEVFFSKVFLIANFYFMKKLNQKIEL